ncbi:MAG: hexose kinase, partial [Anaerolineaceae bacterium]|nr:hexose kinase [Anaerolineaceae bacterium]
GQHAAGHLVSTQPAGKAVNVARVLEHLGRPCILTGFVGQGQRLMFEESFDAKIVQTQLFAAPQPTRENVTLVDLAKGTETHIRDTGHGVRTEDIARLTRKLDILARPDVWMVFAGSLPGGLTTEAFRRMLRGVTEKGARVVLDSSGQAMSVVRHVPVWLIKPNCSELAELTGRPTTGSQEILAAADQLKGAAEVVMVSAGPQGCYLFQGQLALHGWVPRLPKKVANTVGCGDSLLAGYLAAATRSCEPAECLRQAVAAGTGACFQVRAGVVDADEVSQLAGLVEVEVLSE